MKRIIIVLLTVSIFLVLNSCRHSTEQHLMAWYTFTGDARDLSGNGFDGVVHEAILTRDRFGHENCAYDLNGITAYIVARVKKMPAVDQPQSISWWFMVEQPPVYNDSLGADNMIALVDTAAGIGVQTGFRAPGYHSRGLDTWYWGGRTVLESPPPAVNDWHHCVYTYDGRIHRFYLDGQESAQSDVEPQRGTPDVLMFGNYPAGDQFFQGKLDDIRIYNRALTRSEIMNLFNVKD